MKIRTLAILTLVPALSFFSLHAEEDQVKHVDAPATEKLLSEKEAPSVIDLRTPEEFKEGHIDKAQNIDFLAEDFEKNLAKLDKNKPYLVHCQSGGRSTKALVTFEKLGFKHIYHLDGGYKAWAKAKKEETKK